MNLLHIDSSILGANSASRLIAAAVVERLRQGTRNLEVTYRDLAAAPLPHLTLAHLPTDQPATTVSAEQDERDSSWAVLNEFLAADIVVIGAPMYNFTVPSQLKAWIDRILIAGKTFRYTSDGVQGLARGKRVIVAISRGGFYGPNAPSAAAEHVETYLRAVFGFIGITDLEFIVAEGVQISPEQRSQALEGAFRAVTELLAA